MFFAVNPEIPTADKVGKLCICAIITMTCIASTLSPASVMAKSRPNKVAPAEINPNAPDPDALLIEVYKSLAANNLQKAQSKIDALVEAYPHFQLAHLIQGDLLLMHTRPVRNFGVGALTQPDKLKDLRDEAAARLRSYRERPDPELIPRVILQLRDDQKQAIVVDAKKSRLYVYENAGGQPRLVNDFYISQGKFGINKLKEGDQKTPIGVYYITSRLAGAKLPSFYGPGALPLNYPNEWDKFNGRNGSGIWLHGMPPESFSRPPLASDGCVVLTNPDFLKISSMVDIGKTPVIISEQLEFVSRNKWILDRHLAEKLVDDWRMDMQSKNANRILTNYSRNFKTMQGDNLNTWFPKQQQSWDNWHNPVIKLKDVTHFRYPGKDELIVSTFTQETTNGKARAAVRKRQYWLKEAARWRIIYETTV